jgi:hypothetical protein
MCQRENPIRLSGASEPIVRKYISKCQQNKINFDPSIWLFTWHILFFTEATLNIFFRNLCVNIEYPDLTWEIYFWNYLTSWKKKLQFYNRFIYTRELKQHRANNFLCKIGVSLSLVYFVSTCHFAAASNHWLKTWDPNITLYDRLQLIARVSVAELECCLQVHRASTVTYPMMQVPPHSNKIAEEP